MVRVLIVGQTPPPFLGLPIMLKILVDSEMRDVDMRHLRIVLSTNESQVGKFRWGKLFRLVRVIWQIIWARIVQAPEIMYFAPAAASRTSMLRDVVILCSTRFLFPKTVFHYHASGHSRLYERLPRWQKWFFRRAFFNAEGAIRLSELTPEDGKLLKARREYIVPNGIDDPCAEIAPRCDGEFSNDRPLRLLFIALLCEPKGLLILLDACGRLAQRGVPFHLDVMGRFESDEFEARVRKRIAELNIEEQVAFLGVVTGEEKFKVFRRSDVHVHPTFFDTFPVVLLEAMACGLPVVASRWSGIPSIVDDGQTGFIVPPHNPEAVADRVEELAASAQLRQQMGQAGREKFLREFTVPCHIERMRQVFLDLGGKLAAAEEEAEPQEELATAARVSPTTTGY